MDMFQPWDLSSSSFKMYSGQKLLCEKSSLPGKCHLWFLSINQSFHFCLLPVTLVCCVPECPSPSAVSVNLPPSILLRLTRISVRWLLDPAWADGMCRVWSSHTRHHGQCCWKISLLVQSLPWASVNLFCCPFPFHTWPFPQSPRSDVFLQLNAAWNSLCGFTVLNLHLSLNLVYKQSWESCGPLCTVVLRNNGSDLMLLICRAWSSVLSPRCSGFSSDEHWRELKLLLPATWLFRWHEGEILVKS